MKYFLSFFLVFYSFVAFAAFNDPNFNKLQSFGHTQYLEIPRKETNNTYHLFIRTPENYKPVEKAYPVLYLLDAGLTYSMISGYYNILTLLGDFPEIVIVGISYGTNDWKKGNTRGQDFTAKSKEREHWGGAAKFATFLEHTVFPKIETTLAVDTSKRLLMGNSLGGQFGIYITQHRPELFYGVIASNPAIHTNVDYYVSHKPSAKGPYPKLFLGLADNDAPVFKEPREVWLEHWSKEKSRPWEWKKHNFSGHNHVSSIPDAFRYGVPWILKD